MKKISSRPQLVHQFKRLGNDKKKKKNDTRKK